MEKGFLLCQRQKEFFRELKPEKTKSAVNCCLKFGNMSKIGKKIITIPSGVSVKIADSEIFIKGQKNEVKLPVPYGVGAACDDKTVSFTLLTNTKQARSNWGTIRALVANAIVGITAGFEKTLILEGVGYKVIKDGVDLTLSLGFSHPVKYKAVPGIEFEVEKNSILKIKGSDKAVVGKIAAEIRGLKKPEPYKGKGFHYSTETIRRKAGKKSTGGSGS